MKRMTTTLLAGGLVGAIGFTSVAFADTTIYGSVRSGIIHYGSHGGTKASWDLGSVDASDLDASDETTGTGPDKLWSRIGVRASHEINNGMTGGLHIEKRLDNFRTRHQNVWLSGAFGKVTLGQQGSPYYSAVSWDGVYLFGGLQDPSSRRSGVTYQTTLDGPFSFQMGISDDNTAKNKKGKLTGAGDGVDGYELAASYTMGDMATVSLGYHGEDDDGTDSIGGTVGGSVSGLSWKVGYRTDDHANNVDTKYYGFHLGYGIGDGRIYGQYEDFNSDVSTADDDSIILGYTHSLGTNTRVILEHQRPDDGQNRTALALRVDF